MVNLNIVVLTFVLSELDSNPVATETLTETESTTETKIHPRSIDEQRCREFVIFGGECQKNIQLDFYESCLFDGFSIFFADCSFRILSQLPMWFCNNEILTSDIFELKLILNR